MLMAYTFEIKYSKSDKTLREVYYYVKNGWPERLQSERPAIKPFFNRRNNLTLFNNLVCLETNYIRIVIPNALRNQALKMLHDGHWGVVKIQQLARQYIW